MVSETPTEGRCNGKAGEDREGFCESYPVKDDDGEPITGRCRMHNGYGEGIPEGNGNAITHGATAKPGNLYNHLEEDEREWVDSLVAGYIEVAPFGFEDPRRERLTRYCIMIYQEWAAASEVEKAGASESQPIGVNDSGEPVVRREEHHLSKRELALNTKVRQGLKSLDCLPGSGSEAAGETVAQIFAAAVERASEDDEPETITADGGEVSTE